MSGLVQADDRLRECVIVRIPNRADRRLDTGLGVRTPPRPPLPHRDCGEASIRVIKSRGAREEAPGA